MEDPAISEFQTALREPEDVFVISVCFWVS